VSDNVDLGLKAENIEGDYTTWRMITPTAKTAGYIWHDNIGSYMDYSRNLLYLERGPGVD
jgi:hypothetical protein